MIFSRSRSAGMKMHASSPSAAAWAATAPARLPVEAQASTFSPSSRAFADATATTRSLNEWVGFAASILMCSSRRPSARPAGAPRPAATADGQALGRRRGDGQQLDVAPERPRPGLGLSRVSVRAARRSRRPARAVPGTCRTTGAHQGGARHHSGCRPAQSHSREAPLGVRHGHICRARREWDPLDLRHLAPWTAIR